MVPGDAYKQSKFFALLGVKNSRLALGWQTELSVLPGHSKEKTTLVRLGRGSGLLTASAAGADGRLVGCVPQVYQP